MRAISLLRALMLPLLLSGCTVTLVQPYDQDLYKNTEAFYKKASAMIIKGEISSPLTTQDVAKIPSEKAAENAGHFSRFESSYSALIIDSNALILRSLANSGKVNEIGKSMQRKLEQIIRSSTTAACESLQQDFPLADLTTKNYIDLKCLVTKWRQDHQNAGIPGGARQILKKANWEGRERSLFDAILAIQSAEAFKNKSSAGDKK